ncbi:hypothetical protein [Paenibacillus oleatilyticus]|uniref:hypothetical protein n=1 Tax=Paenibacillus oleatilyticus TaxID=2594886 RepID=UPI001C1FE1EA|nr:hypothetical protein [Paenibacillus oleatilyticus]MBU7314041.1 hypothetical protein [Paenibacillus oleatilyticus]
MIAVLYKNGKYAGFVDNVQFIDGQDIIGATGAARGVTHDVLVTDDGKICSEQVETARFKAITGYDEKGDPIEGETILYETRYYWSTSKGEFRPGDPFDPKIFTDKRHLLGKTDKQVIDELNKANVELALKLKKQEEHAAAVSADLQAFMEYIMTKGE